jgi:cation transport protein ChaC
VLAYLHEREMITGVYIPTWLNLETAQGTVYAAGFVVDREHVQYTGRLSPEETAELILQGHGARGPCKDYLANTVRHLEGLGLGAGPLKRLLRLVESR